MASWSVRTYRRYAFPAHTLGVCLVAGMVAAGLAPSAAAARPLGGAVTVGEVAAAMLRHGAPRAAAMEACTLFAVSAPMERLHGGRACAAILWVGGGVGTLVHALEVGGGDVGLRPMAVAMLGARMVHVIVNWNELQRRWRWLLLTAILLAWEVARAVIAPAFSVTGRGAAFVAGVLLSAVCLNNPVRLQWEEWLASASHAAIVVVSGALLLRWVDATG